MRILHVFIRGGNLSEATERLNRDLPELVDKVIALDCPPPHNYTIVVVREEADVIERLQQENKI